LRELFNKHGDIKRFFNLISNRGMAFITYYDLRDAESAKKDLQDIEVDGRPIDIHYSIPRDDDEGEDQDPNNGTLFICIKDPTEKVSNDELYTLFAQWGDIKEVRDCRGKPNQKFVECYDLRLSQDIFEKRQSIPFSGGTLDIKHAYKSSRDKDKEKDGGGPLRRNKDKTSTSTSNPLSYPYTTPDNNAVAANLLSQLSALFSQPNMIQSIIPGVNLDPNALSLLYNQNNLQSQTGSLTSQQSGTFTPSLNQQTPGYSSFVQPNYNIPPSLSNFTNTLTSSPGQQPNTSTTYNINSTTPSNTNTTGYNPNNYSLNQQQQQSYSYPNYLQQ